MNDLGKKFELFVIVVIIALVGIIYAFRQKPVLTPVTDNPNITQAGQIAKFPVTGNPTELPVTLVPSNIIEYKGIDGKNALEILQASHKVEVKQYSFGDLVTGIDGITPDATHFWAMYVNGQFSQVGASAYKTQPSDTIKWQIDAVVNTP